MQWSTLLQPHRFGLDSSEEDGRSQFHKDYDRLIFSQSLRRLARKTQVHPLALNDHVHTRLTHSLEVASVGRSLGQKVGEIMQRQASLPAFVQPEDLGVIVQSACLAHDIGNPPFGHTGENCIKDWFQQPINADYLGPLNDHQYSDFIQYDGNAQGFRIVTQLEKHWFSGGLRLTLPTLGALLKYPWGSLNSPLPGKFSCFYAEQPLLQKLSQSLGLVSNEFGWCRHPLAYLVEAADDICYLILDLEDALELDILRWDEFLELFTAIIPAEAMKKNIESQIQPKKTRMAIIRGLAMETIIESFVATFIEHESAYLASREQRSLTELTQDESVKQFLKTARSFSEDIIFKNRDKTGIEIGAYATLETLLNGFIPAGFAVYSQGYEKISSRHRALIELMGNCQPHEHLSCYEIYLRCLDYISGMTDQYAQRLANQIRGI